MHADRSVRLHGTRTTSLQNLSERLMRNLRSTTRLVRVSLQLCDEGLLIRIRLLDL
ncbi:hypothetical protein M404DRAFT_1007346 [Pisolithus tinctorius Marx 270]|uniref:Uncharacterized protein n=1 Tax=Pisolithus tinctorius Marx 270 TaxID=870435 RepID=A0A0C3N3E3_PISTI|nr:hypothetical protein M404DRAFT_1007346 [Pisolithus tinctorius Marx 270]